jgi:hypothetical protein
MTAGDRMLSRLAEMCIRLKMTGKDCRRTGIKRARFGWVPRCRIE